MIVGSKSTWTGDKLAVWCGVVGTRVSSVMVDTVLNSGAGLLFYLSTLWSHFR